MSQIDPNITLGKDIKLRQLLTLGVGSIIGAGWLVILGSWLGNAGAAGALLAVIGGASLMVLVGLCYAEVATMYPVSGGEVAYAYEIYGLEVCFATGWFLALGYIVVAAFEAISLGWVLSALIPGIGGPVIYSFLGHEVKLLSLLAGLAIMAAIGVVNYRGAKATATTQEVLTYLFAAAAALFIVAGLVRGDVANLEPYFVKDAGGQIWPGIMAVLVTIPFLFAGFDSIPQAMGEKEADAPLHKAGRVIVFSVIGAGIFYALVLVSTAMTIPRSNMMVLDLPVAGAFEAAFDSPWLAKAVLVAGLIGLITTWNAVYFAAARVIFALGRARIIPLGLGRVHRRVRAPSNAVLLVGIAGALLTFLGRNAIIPLANVSTFSLAIVFFTVCVGLIRQRRRQPHHARPFRVPGGLAIPAGAVMMTLFMIFITLQQAYANAAGAFPIEWIIIIIWSALGLLFWLAASRVRATVTESERREFILADDPSQP